MSNLIIHGRATSSNVQPVVWLTEELGLDYERRDIGGAFGGTDAPEYRAINPMGLVPAIEDGSVAMFESQAILRYLAARHGPEALWPADPVARAPIDQWMEWAKTAVAPVMIYKVFWQLIRTPAADRDHALIKQGEAELHALTAIAEARLSEGRWLAGNQMTLADFTFGASLYRYFTLDFERAPRPNLEAYYARLCALPAYAAHVMVSYEPLRVSGA